MLAQEEDGSNGHKTNHLMTLLEETVSDNFCFTSYK